MFDVIIDIMLLYVNVFTCCLCFTCALSVERLLLEMLNYNNTSKLTLEKNRISVHSVTRDSDGQNI